MTKNELKETDSTCHAIKLGHLRKNKYSFKWGLSN